MGNVSKEDLNILNNKICVSVIWNTENGEISIDRDQMIEELEEMVDAVLEEVSILKCGFCGEELNSDVLYCSKECHKADNTEGV